MSATDLAAVTNQIQKYWAPIFTKQLRANWILPELVSKDYDGEIKRQGDTVRVSQINKGTGQLLTVGTNADSFNTQSVSTSYVDIKADKRAVSAYEFQDLVELQSQVNKEKPEFLQTMRDEITEQVNNHLYSLVAPSASAPDHTLTSVTDFNAAQLSACRILAAQAHWPKDGRWYCLPDPVYYGDLLNSVTITGSDYGADDAPLIGGQIALKRFGFNVLEDDSRGADEALLFHPDFLHMVSQMEVNFKVSDLHAQKKFGYVISADLVFGAKLGIDGDNKHITVR